MCPVHERWSTLWPYVFTLVLGDETGYKSTNKHRGERQVTKNMYSAQRQSEKTLFASRIGAWMEEAGGGTVGRKAFGRQQAGGIPVGVLSLVPRQNKKTELEPKAFGTFCNYPPGIGARKFKS